jgi:hypothetical protein
MFVVLPDKQGRPEVGIDTLIDIYNPVYTTVFRVTAYLVTYGVSLRSACGLHETV